MAHLILPIEIEGVKYCANQHGNRATEGLDTQILFPSDPVSGNTERVGPGGPWTITLQETQYQELSIGIACGDNVQISYSAFGPAMDENDILVGAYVDGVFISTIILGDVNPTSASKSYFVGAGPCGNVLTLLFYRESESGEVPVNVEVTIESIT